MVPHRRLLATLRGSAAALLAAPAPLVALAQGAPPAPATRWLGPPGFVSPGPIVAFEDIEPLSAGMRQAMAIVRAGQYGRAIDLFRAAQKRDPADPLAFRGEVQSAARNGSVLRTAARFRELLAAAPPDRRRRAVLHYALGSAIMAPRLGTGAPGEAVQDLGPEPREHFVEALRLDPRLVLAHLALAIYYEHPSQRNGTAARKHYDAARSLRPDLACKLRFLHALTWRRPGFVSPQEMARLHRQGFDVPEDRRRIPEKTIAECKNLIEDYPDYAPAYEEIADCYEWPIGDKEAAAKYRRLAAAVRARTRSNAARGEAASQP